MFKGMSTKARGNLMEASGLCIICLGGIHTSAECKFAKGARFTCKLCGDAHVHHWQLHGATVHGKVLHTHMGAVAVATGCGDGGVLAAVETDRGEGIACGSGVVLRLLQVVTVSNAPKCLALWDPGSQVSLITHRYAKSAGLKGKNQKMVLTVAGGGTTEFDTQEYVLPLIDREGNVHDLQVYGMDDITSSIKEVNKKDMEVAIGMFPQVSPAIIENPSGRVDLLLGLSHIGLYPTEVGTVGNLGLPRRDTGIRT